MKVNEMIVILQDIEKRIGNVKMDGVCWGCTTSGFEITVLEDACNNYVAISLGTSEEEEDE
jgi:hypothetical protein